MALSIPRRLSTETVLRRRHFTVEQHKLETADGAHEAVTLRMPDWVSIVAVASGRVVLVRQHRHGIDALTLEAPGGLVDPGEDPAVAGLRELREETGFTADVAQSLGFVHPNPAFQDNRCFFFLALGAVDTGRLDNDAHESTEPVLLGPAEVRAAMSDGRISHALAVVALERALRAAGL